MQILAGLRKHIEQPQLEGSLVVVILNLKAAKLAGELSEGCVHCIASTRMSPCAAAVVDHLDGHYGKSPLMCPSTSSSCAGLLTG
jgi:tRNA-binding EMAP/Myf-like protein